VVSFPFRVAAVTPIGAERSDARGRHGRFLVFPSPLLGSLLPRPAFRALASANTFPQSQSVDGDTFIVSSNIEVYRDAGRARPIPSRVHIPADGGVVVFRPNVRARKPLVTSERASWPVDFSRARSAPQPDAPIAGCLAPRGPRNDAAPLSARRSTMPLPVAPSRR